MLTDFNNFLQDDTSWAMFITGPAGTGKTTKLKELVDYSISCNYKTMVCAFTHKACGILAEKLSSSTEIVTLHSLLKKRPTINEQAIKVQHLEKSLQHGSPNQYDVIFIDEFSMIGESDYMDIVSACEDEDGEQRTKVVYIGDLNQLPPVNDMQTIIPKEPHWVKLTKIYRQHNSLLEPLAQLVSYIEGTAKPSALIPNDNFIRNVDLIVTWNKLDSDDKVLLAYTNQQVQYLNAEIHGKDTPEVYDFLFSPTTRMYYSLVEKLNAMHVTEISKAFGDAKLELHSKFKSLEHLLTMPNIEYYSLDSDIGCSIHAVIFGHYNYKLYLDALKVEAAEANRACEVEQKQSQFSTIRMWADVNRNDPKAKRRRKAWRDYLTFKECVICIDFPYAMTVHKAQGSTYEYVLIDADDIHQCAKRDLEFYLKLMYVAISRASKQVYTN